MNNNDDNDVWIFDVFQRVLICFVRLWSLRGFHWFLELIVQGTLCVKFSWRDWHGLTRFKRECTARIS